MNLKTFKEKYLLNPEQTIIIDRSFKINGDEIYLIALTFKKNSYSLWSIERMEGDISDYEAIKKGESETIRTSFKRRKKNDVRFINSIEVGEYFFNFNMATTDVFLHHANESYNRLRYFIDKGAKLTNWDDVNLDKLQLTEFMCSWTKPRIDIDILHNHIKVNLMSYLEEKDVYYKYNVNYDIQEPVELKYFNPFENYEESFYIHSFETYNLDKYISSIKAHDKYSETSKEQIESMIEVVSEYFEDNENQNLTQILMTYESDSILQIYSTDYLERDTHQLSKSKSAYHACFFKPNNEKGVHGKKLYVASLLVNSKENISSIDFEIHSISINHPSEIIII